MCVWISFKMSLPSLHMCSHQRCSQDDILTQWECACGDGAPRPQFKPWSKFSREDENEALYEHALQADSQDGDAPYLTAYELRRLKSVLEAEAFEDKESVQRVMPPSFLNGNDPHVGEGDPNGLIVATRSANSRRSNHPLYLWPNPPNKIPISDFVQFHGVKHYVVPEVHKARIARKWLYMRATYARTGIVEPPSEAQSEHINSIVALVKHSPPSKVEKLVDQQIREKYKWSNPLIHCENADVWFDNPAWRNLVAGGV